MRKPFFVSLAISCFMAALWLKPEPTSVESSREPSGKRATEPFSQSKASPKAIQTASGSAPKLGEKSSAIATANAYLASHQEELGIQRHHELRPEEFSSPLGTSVKYTVYQGTHLVMGVQLEVFVNRKGAVSRVINGYRPIEEASDEAWSKPLRHFTDGLTVFESENPPTALFYAPESGALKAEAAYAVEVKNKSTGETHQGIFRASDGQVLALSKGRSEP